MVNMDDKHRFRQSIKVMVGMMINELQWAGVGQMK
jgi:hypothetical protein